MPAIIPTRPRSVAALFDEFGFARQAEEAYRKAAAANPGEPQQLARLIGFLGRQERTAEALELWEGACKVLPAEVAADLGTTVVTMPSATDAQRQKVEAWLARALKEQPSSRVLPLKLAFVWMNQGRNDEAQALYRQILASTPDDVEALNNLASLLAFQDDARKKDEALKQIDRAIAAAGGVPALLDTRAVVNLRRGQPEKALADLRQALAKTPEFSILHFHLAQAYHQSGNDAEAKKAFAQAERLGLRRDDVDRVERDEYDRLRRQLTGG